MTPKDKPLQPCPFCGSLELQLCRTNPRACWVRCDKCGADAPSHKTRKGAILNWNTRPEQVHVAHFVEDDESDYKAREKRIIKSKKGE